MIEFLQWDSGFFNLKTGRASLYKATASDVSELIVEKQKERYDVVYLFVQHIEADAEQLISNSGGLLTDYKTTFLKSQIEGGCLTSSIVPYRGALTPELLELAYLSGHDSRFNKDPRLNTRFFDLYRLWIEKSLTGEMADSLLVYMVHDKIRAFVTLQNKQTFGQIGLIAVSPQMQGKGVGIAMMEAAHHWYWSHHLPMARVVTQHTNMAACNLYLKSGYHIEKTERIYHL